MPPNESIDTTLVTQSLQKQTFQNYLLKSANRKAFKF